MKNDFYDELISNISIEQIKIKRNFNYYILYLIIAITFFFVEYYKTISLFIIFILLISYFLIKKLFNIKKERMIELDISKKYLLEDEELRNELNNGKLNSLRKFLLTEKFYVDLSRYVIIKFEDIQSMKLKLSLGFLPFTEKYGLRSFIVIKTKDNQKLKILNWSLNNRFPEDGEIYDIFATKTGKKIY